MTPAEMLKAAIAGTQGHNPTAITDEFAQAIARELDQTNPTTAAEALAAEISKGSRTAMALNGPDVLRAALAGGPGTINPEGFGG